MRWDYLQGGSYTRSWWWVYRTKKISSYPSDWFMKYLECQTLFGINQKKLFLQMYFVQKELAEIKRRLLHMEIMVGCRSSLLCYIISCLNNQRIQKKFCVHFWLFFLFWNWIYIFICNRENYRKNSGEI